MVTRKQEPKKDNALDTGLVPSPPVDADAPVNAEQDKAPGVKSVKPKVVEEKVRYIATDYFQGRIDERDVIFVSPRGWVGPESLSFRKEHLQELIDALHKLG